MASKFDPQYIVPCHHSAFQHVFPPQNMWGEPVVFSGEAACNADPFEGIDWNDTGIHALVKEALNMTLPTLSGDITSYCEFASLPPADNNPRPHICSQKHLVLVPQRWQSSHHHPSRHSPASCISRGLHRKCLHRRLMCHHHLGSSSHCYHPLQLVPPISQVPMVLQIPTILIPHHITCLSLRIWLEHPKQLTTHLGTHVTLDA